MRIVFLVFAPNTAYVSVVKRVPKGVKVSPDKKTWTWQSPFSEPPRRIGESRYIGDNRYGIIGVYDLDEHRQIDMMVHDAVESQRDHSHED